MGTAGRSRRLPSSPSRRLLPATPRMPHRKRVGPEHRQETSTQKNPPWTFERLVALTEASRVSRTRTSPPTFEDVIAISEEIATRSRGEPSQALRLAETLVEVARFDSAASIAAARRCRGHVFRRLGRHRDAIRDYTQALESFERLGMKLEAARTVIGIVGASGYLGRSREGVRLAARYRPVFIRHGEIGRAARLDVNVGFLAERSGRPREALRAYERAASIFERQGAQADLALVRFNQANALVSIDRYEEGLSLHRSSAEAWRSLGAVATVCRCQLAIGSVLLRLGRLDEALRLLEETSDQANTLEDPVVTATAALDLARAQLLVGRLGDVSSRLDAAISGFQSLGIHPDLAEALCLRGDLHGRLGRWEDAALDWKRASDLYRGIRHARGAAWADFSRGNALRRIGREGESRRLLGASLRRLQRHGPALLEMEARLLLSEQDIEARPAQARRHLLAVRSRLRSVRDPWVEYGYWIVRARLERHVRAYRTARTALDRAYRILRDLRSRAPLESLQAEWVGRRDELFRQALDPLGSQGGQPVQAADARWMFLWSERARAPRFTFGWEVTSSSHAGNDASTQEAFERSREELYWLDHQERSRRAAPSDSAGAGLRRLVAWRRKRDRAMTRVERYGRRLELLTSRQHVSRDPDPTAIQEALAGDECLVEFFAGDRTVLTFVVTRGAIQTLPPLDADELRQMVLRLRQVWDRYRLGSGFVRRHEAALASTTAGLLEAVRSALVDPFLETLPGDIRTLVVSPHAWLRGIPFHAMVHEPLDVRYALSGQSLVSESGSEGHRGGVLVVGVASDDAPAAEREALAVARMHPGSTLLLGKDATRQAVRERWPSADVIHVAAHGTIQVDDPRMSGVHLSDGTWTVHDLRSTATKARLAVLSSCRSGDTVLWGADHQVGLLPALFEQGPRTAVLSLWPADDESTRILMSVFHHEIAQRRSVGDALRIARRVIREVKPAPYYWAPFVQYGAELRGGFSS